jgi:C-terminal processing protease CtpA/Prc
MVTFAARCLLLLSLVLATAGVQAGERGYFGFGLSVTTKGFFLNPEVSELKIAKVIPGTPAERAGILVGDVIVLVDDMPVLGNKALHLKARAAKDVGQTIRLALRHPDGKAYSVSMIAIPHP